MYPGNGLLTQNIDTARLAQAISAQLNEDIPASQVIRAVKRFNKSFLPYFRTTNVTFTATSELSTTLTLNIDASFGFFVTGIAGVQSSEDYNGFVNTIQINNGYNLLVEPLPFQLTTRYTGIPLQFSMYVPPVSNLQTTLRNGSTTAAATFYLTYFGYKLPRVYIDELTAGMKG